METLERCLSRLEIQTETGSQNQVPVQAEPVQLRHRRSVPNEAGFQEGDNVRILWDKEGNIWKGLKKTSSVEGAVVLVTRTTKKFIIYIDDNGVERKKRNHNVVKVQS